MLKSIAVFLAGAVLTIGIIASTLLHIGPATADTSASSQSQTTGWQAPRCYEDQVIARGGRCIDHDDSTTRFKRVSEAGWGYWYDTRHMDALKREARVPACHRWQMVSRWGGCVRRWHGDFRGGWWYRS